MQKQRIPPNPTTKQEILSLRRMGFPAQKKMEHMEKEIYARQKNLRKSNKQMAANHIWMPPPSRPFILLSRSSVSNMCKMHRRARRNNFKHFTVLVLAPSLIAAVVMMIPMIIDGFTQRLTSYESTNFKRFITGFLFGVGIAALFSYSVIYTFQAGYKYGVTLAIKFKK